ncbi:VOC family protein [bacterium]|jgi:uncharacterized protein|nr:VOC family protein [bacterium]
MNQHEKINYLEYPAKDFEKTKLFFTSVFNWSFTSYGPDYIAFDDQGVEGGFFRSENCSTSKNGACLTVFFSKSLHSTLEKIETNKGTIVKPIFSFPGGHRFHFLDPNGNEFAVWSDKLD